MQRGAILVSATVVAVALLVAGCATALLLVTQKAEATFPGKNGKIAYESNGVIYSINPDGSGKTKVTRGYEPSYSPDGKKIAYTSFDGHDDEIYTIKVGGGGKSRVTDNKMDDEEPSYSPDGKRIAYDINGVIYTIKVGGGGKRKVTNNTNNKSDSNPSYSPSGGKIAYEEEFSSGDTEICTINVGGGGKVQVTNNDTDDYNPDYSPNGNRIVYEGFEGRAGENASDEASTNIYTIKVGGGGKFNVTNSGKNDFVPNTSPSYSPDGEKIAYVSPDSGYYDREIYTVKVGGGGKSRVTNNATSEDGLSWGSRP